MTDTHSNDTQRVFSAETPPKISADYERLSNVEKQIEECLQLSEADFLARLKITDRKAQAFLSEESLICLLSLAHSEGLSDVENAIANKLYRSCEKRIKKVLWEDSFDENFIEEAVADIYMLMWKQILYRTEKCYDFWEVRFYKTLNMAISGYRRKYADQYRATDLFSARATEDEPDYESTVIDERNTVDRQEKLLAAQQTLARMPKDLRQIFVMYYIDEETQENIAKTFGMTARTVRNRLQSIKELIDSLHNSQGDTE